MGEKKESSLNFAKCLDLSRNFSGVLSPNFSWVPCWGAFAHLNIFLCIHKKMHYVVETPAYTYFHGTSMRKIVKAVNANIDLMNVLLEEKVDECTKTFEFHFCALKLLNFFPLSSPVSKTCSPPRKTLVAPPDHRLARQLATIPINPSAVRQSTHLTPRPPRTKLPTSPGLKVPMVSDQVAQII